MILILNLMALHFVITSGAFENECKKVRNGLGVVSLESSDPFRGDVVEYIALAKYFS
jgi:hypothetical protein